MFLSIIFLSFLVLSDEQDCKFSVSGKEYDLSALSGRTATGDDSKISTYHYTAAVCADMSDECEDIMTGQKLKGVVYQMGGEPGQQAVCWDMLAKWDSVESGPLDSSSGKPSGTDGVTLSFSNGDPCRGKPRKTKMNMICDPQHELGTISGFRDDSDDCLFVINFPTSHACSGAPPGPTTTEPHRDHGINGTFAGYVSCVSSKCDLPAGSVQVTIYGDCEHMVAFVPSTIKGTELWQISFDVCQGNMAMGTVKSESGGAPVELFNFDAFYMEDEGRPYLSIILYENRPPFSELMIIAAYPVHHGTTIPPSRTTPVPIVDWGINGTFLGNFPYPQSGTTYPVHHGTTIPPSGTEIHVTIQGDCDAMASVTSGPDIATEVWQVSFDVCSGNMGRGTIKNAHPGPKDKPLDFEAFFIPGTHETVPKLQVIIYEAESPHNVLITFDATKVRDYYEKILDLKKPWKSRLIEGKGKAYGFGENFKELKAEIGDLMKNFWADD